MKVFLSWSRDRSRQVAEALKPWLKCVLQSTTPWISTSDIDRGSLWQREIGNNLQESTVGIICLTRENLTSPWILFEAGALAKGLETNRVCTLLIDLGANEVIGPLAQFNHTPFDKQSIEKLVFSINNLLETPVEPSTLKKTFEAFWPELDSQVKQIIEDTPNQDAADPPKETDILKGIAGNLGLLISRMGQLESKVQNLQTIPNLGFNAGGLLNYPNPETILQQQLENQHREAIEAAKLKLQSPMTIGSAHRRTKIGDI